MDDLQSQNSLNINLENEASPFVSWFKANIGKLLQIAKTIYETGVILEGNEKNYEEIIQRTVQHCLQKTKSDLSQKYSFEIQQLQREKEVAVAAAISMEKEKLTALNMSLEALQREVENHKMQNAHNKVSLDTLLLNKEAEIKSECNKILADLRESFSLEKQNMQEKLVMNRMESLSLQEREQEKFVGKILDLENQKSALLSDHKAEIEKIRVEHDENIKRFLDKYMSATTAVKGSMAEQSYEILLSQLFPTAEITRTANIPGYCDILMKVGENTNILFEIKHYNANVPGKEITKFLSDLSSRQSHGIMISVTSGIANRSDFQLELVDDTFVALYLVENRHNGASLKLAVNMLFSVLNLTTSIKDLKAELNESDDRPFLIQKCNIEKINRCVNLYLSKNSEAIKEAKKLVGLLEQNNITEIMDIFKDMPGFTPESSAPKQIYKTIGGRNKSFFCERCNKQMRSEQTFIAHIEKFHRQ